MSPTPSVDLPLLIRTIGGQARLIFSITIVQSLESIHVFSFLHPSLKDSATTVNKLH